MALRHKCTSRKNTGRCSIFPKDDYYKMKVSLQVNLLLKPHPEDPKWMEVYMPPYLVLREKIKRFSMARFSTIKDCYLLPAAPSVYEAMAMHIKCC
jgi:hypothetical protein